MKTLKKITKAFVVDLDSSENQNILKSSSRPFNNQAHQVNEVPAKIAEKIYKLIESAKHPDDDTILNHNKIKEAFFSPFKPQLKDAQVFLSHSHADKNKALKVKNYLESETNHRVFIDSLFWDYKNNVLKEIKKHHIDVSKIEDAFTLILRESLQDMIEKCPYFVFLQNNNSVSNQGLSCTTYSAWVYEELKIAHSIRESRLTPMMESMQVFHDISPFLESLETITLKELSHIINS
ncbi:toll/interleukin-1 receptor domain-containing protein [Helicobacter pylori]|nr:toll/interleukin-1 receptor domain-containing protein [Helicobacter pylori]